MLEFFERRGAAPLAERDAEPDHDAGDRGVHAGLQHRQPEQEADQQIRRELADAQTIERHQPRHAGRSPAEGLAGDVGGEQQRDEDDGAEVVDDRKPEQEYA